MLKQTPRIEENNDIKVNVYGYEKGRFHPLYIRKYREKSVVLLLISTEDKVHFVLLKFVNGLLCGLSKAKVRNSVCQYCLQNFPNDRNLEKHEKECIMMNGVQATRLPKPGTKVRFVNYHRQLEVPFVIYADFEFLHRESKEKKGEDTDAPCMSISDTHECCGFGYKVVSGNP
jgi:hypothetical protein